MTGGFSFGQAVLHDWGMDAGATLARELETMRFVPFSEIISISFHEPYCGTRTGQTGPWKKEAGEF